MKETSDVGKNMTTADTRNPQVQALQQRYWRTNIKLMLVLLTCWAIVGLGCGVLFADWLNQFKPFGGFPLGFWFAQQGSIIGFVLIILIYAVAMNVLDKKHQEAMNRLGSKGGNNPAEDPSGHDRITNGEGGDA